MIARAYSALQKDDIFASNSISQIELWGFIFAAIDANCGSLDYTRDDKSNLSLLFIAPGLYHSWTSGLVFVHANLRLSAFGDAGAVHAW
jgi:hypothetical protein